MKTGDKGIALIKLFEGCKLRPYRCPAALWTVGFGTVLYMDQIRLKMPERMAYPLRPEHNRAFSPEEIDAFLREELSQTERGVARLCPATTGNQSQFDALVSFAYNCGVGALQRSSIRLAYNRGEVETAAEGFLKYTRGGGRVLPGLVRRRGAERALFLAGVSH
jgi:lysozyme